jgi:hypothetical protein
MITWFHGRVRVVRGSSMPLICYVLRKGDAVPYFEVLPEVSEDQAVRRAAVLLADRPDGLRAELWDGERLVRTVERETA